MIWIIYSSWYGRFDFHIAVLKGYANFDNDLQETLEKDTQVDSEDDELTQMLSQRNTLLTRTTRALGDADWTNDGQNETQARFVDSEGEDLPTDPSEAVLSQNRTDQPPPDQPSPEQSDESDDEDEKEREFNRNKQLHIVASLAQLVPMILKHLEDQREMAEDQELPDDIPVSSTVGKRKRLPKKAKALVPLQNERILRSASVKENRPKMPQLIDKPNKPVINVDEIENPPPSSDAKQALFPFPPGISAEHKLDFLLSSPFVNEQYSKQRLVAMFVDDEKDDYPLLYVDIRRYQVNGWMSNHFVSAYFYLLRKRFNKKNVKFLDTSFWSNYITEPDSSDSVTQGAWVAKVKRVLNTYNISDGDAIYIPALVNENHFILLYINVRERDIKVFDPLGLRHDSAINTLVNLLQKVYQLSSWNIDDNINMLWISRQTDMHSCAFYVCFYAYQHALTGSLQLKYGTAILKKRIMLSLLQREVIPLHTDLTVEEDEAISKQSIL